MPWVEREPEPCKHPERPEAAHRDSGRVWECPTCQGRYAVESIDYGHDVMPGESPVGARWRVVRAPVQNGDSRPPPEGAS